MIDPNRVFAVGFSAGGHLAGSLALLSNDPDVLAAIGAQSGENTPNGVVLSYPVVTALHNTHEGSFVNLTATPFSEIPNEKREQLSLERHVKKNSPPAFIWHTATDTVVPIVGSLRLAQAYCDAGATVMMHTYPYGPHGLALSSFITAHGNPDVIEPLAAGWVDTAVEFLKSIKK
jgi:acetyl esterase/lipase